MTNDSSDEIRFRRTFEGEPGELVQLSPLVRRMVANNSGPFTFTGTCTYVVGRGEVAIVDPGPADPAHVEALLTALKGETIRASFVTHTHYDHSPASRLLKEATGAEIIGCAPYAPPQGAAEEARFDAAHDRDHAPDRVLADGDVFEGEGFTLGCVTTPGHTANHQCFALAQEKALFSGDHVMAWSTSVVAPPDGSMPAYMKSLEKLLARDDKVYWPGHGDRAEEPQRFVRALMHHRRAREESIRNRINAGDRKIETIVANIYKDLDPRLIGGASMSVLAHLESLIAAGKVICDGQPTLTASYHPSGT